MILQTQRSLQFRWSIRSITRISANHLANRQIESSSLFRISPSVVFALADVRLSPLCQPRRPFSSQSISASEMHNLLHPISKRTLKATLQHLHSLRTDHSSRTRSNQCVIFGRKVIEEYLSSGSQCLALFVPPECRIKGVQTTVSTVSSTTQHRYSSESLSSSSANSSSRQMPVAQEIPLAELSRISGMDTTPSDVCAAVIPLSNHSSPSSTLRSAQRVLVLDGLSDPGNVGTLFRSALAFDFRHVVLVAPSCDPLNDKAMRAAMGATVKLHIWCCSEADFLTYLRSPSSTTPKGPTSSALPKLAICDARREKSTTIQSLVKDSPQTGGGSTPPLWLVIGNEAHGIRPAFHAAADARLHIGMTEGVESLNAAVAGSILMQQVYAIDRDSKKN